MRLPDCPPRLRLLRESNSPSAPRTRRTPESLPRATHVPHAKVFNGQSRSLTGTPRRWPAPPYAQVSRQAAPPIFQAGHAGSIPVSRSSSKAFFASSFVISAWPRARCGLLRLVSYPRTWVSSPKSAMILSLPPSAFT